MTRAMSILDYCMQVEEVIEHEKMNDVCVVAHSFGGRVAMLLASRNEKIKSLVLVDSAGLKPKKTFKYYFRHVGFRIKKFFKMNTANCGSEDYRKLSPLMRQTFCNVVNTYLDYLPPKIKQNTLIVWGKKDKETPMYMAKQLNKDIQNSGLALLDGGHFCYIEKLKEFELIVQSFLESESKCNNENKLNLINNGNIENKESIENNENKPKEISIKNKYLQNENNENRPKDITIKNQYVQNENNENSENKNKISGTEVICGQ